MDQTGNWLFEVVTVKQDDNVQIPSTTTSNDVPVKIKLRAKRRNAEDSPRQGFITLPKTKRTNGYPNKIRLVHSDQTIMSFNMMWEPEHISEPRHKSQKFFRLFKTGKCLKTQGEDNNEPPYMVKTSIDSGNIKSKDVLPGSDVENENRVSDEAPLFFFGKCKRGGCLDPPFGEDKYKYQPFIKSNPILQEKEKYIEANCEKLHEDLDKNDEITVKTSDSKMINNDGTNNLSTLMLYKGKSEKCSLDKNYSDSIITYPPESDIVSRDKSTTIETTVKSDKVIDAFFTPPKIAKSPEKNTDKRNEINNNIPSKDPLSSDFEEDRSSLRDINRVTSSTLHLTIKSVHVFESAKVVIQSLNIKTDTLQVTKLNSKDLNENDLHNAHDIIALETTKLDDSAINRAEFNPSYEFIDKKQKQNISPVLPIPHEKHETCMYANNIESLESENITITQSYTSELYASQESKDLLLLDRKMSEVIQRHDIEILVDNLLETSMNNKRTIELGSADDNITGNKDTDDKLQSMYLTPESTDKKSTGRSVQVQNSDVISMSPGDNITDIKLNHVGQKQYSELVVENSNSKHLSEEKLDRNNFSIISKSAGDDVGEVKLKFANQNVFLKSIVKNSNGTHSLQEKDIQSQNSDVILMSPEHNISDVKIEYADLNIPSEFIVEKSNGKHLSGEKVTHLQNSEIILMDTQADEIYEKNNFTDIDLSEEPGPLLINESLKKVKNSDNVLENPDDDDNQSQKRTDSTTQLERNLELSASTNKIFEIDDKQKNINQNENSIKNYGTENTLILNEDNYKEKFTEDRGKQDIGLISPQFYEETERNNNGRLGINERKYKTGEVEENNQELTTKFTEDFYNSYKNVEENVLDLYGDNFIYKPETVNDDMIQINTNQEDNIIVDKNSNIKRNLLDTNLTFQEYKKELPIHKENDVFITEIADDNNNVISTVTKNLMESKTNSPSKTYSLPLDTENNIQDYVRDMLSVIFEFKYDISRISEVQGSNKILFDTNETINKYVSKAKMSSEINSNKQEHASFSPSAPRLPPKNVISSNIKTISQDNLKIENHTVGTTKENAKTEDILNNKNLSEVNFQNIQIDKVSPIYQNNIFENFQTADNNLKQQSSKEYNIISLDEKTLPMTTLNTKINRLEMDNDFGNQESISKQSVKYISTKLSHDFNSMKEDQSVTKHNKEEYSSEGKQPSYSIIKVKDKKAEDKTKSLKASLNAKKLSIMQIDDNTIEDTNVKNTVIEVGFQSYLNDSNEKVLRTFDVSKNPERFPNDSLSVIKTILNKSDDDVSFAINSETKLIIYRNNKYINIQDKCIKMREDHNITSKHFNARDIERLQSSLATIYENELVPAHNLIKSLIVDIENVNKICEQNKRKLASLKKFKIPKSAYSNTKCACMKK